MQIVTANRLDDGSVVYLDGQGGWSGRIEDSRRAESLDDAEALMALANQAVADCLVVGPYLIDIADEDGAVRPLHYREAIRAKGPTVRPDLGKQAEA